MIALIMAGGIGSRFWPLSRKNNPKQFLPIISDKSMIRMTADRLLKYIDITDIFVVTSESQREPVYKHLPDLPKENVIVEPFGMNTAPCIAFSNLYLKRKYKKNETVVVLPSDHLIKNEDDFIEKLKMAERGAKKGYLVTFGIKPNYPATGYGYIEIADLMFEKIYKVNSFKEKPDKKTAEKFLNSGKFLWNSGMFIWNLGSIIVEYKKHQPEIMNLISEIEAKWDKNDYDISEIYMKMPKLPVDIAIMEKTEKKAVIPVDFGWSDVGSWKALYDISEKDENNNLIKSENITIDANNNLIISKKFVSLVGVKNVVLVETDDAILLIDLNRTEDVKKVVERLKKENREKYL